MAITTTTARQYTLRTLGTGVLCLGFAAWGGYDLWVKLPRQEARATRYEALMERTNELAARQVSNGTLAPEEQAEARELLTELDTIAPGGKTPKRPGKYDPLVCWLFIACLPLAPYFFWRYAATRRKVYRLEDDGTLVLPGGERWSAEEIADIDMDRWMRKSVAEVVHRDGRRAKLDDYVHRGTHLIVGALASRFHPESWDAEARRKTAATETAAAEESAGDEPDDGEAPALKSTSAAPQEVDRP